MQKTATVFIVILLVTGLFNCAGNKTFTLKDLPTQSSVQINLVDGGPKEGIVVTTKKNQLIYVDAESHSVDTLNFRDIVNIKESKNIYDFYGNVIPTSEIKDNKSYKNTLLYGTGGLVLGTAVGFGAFVAILVSDSTQSGAANLTMAACGLAGAYIFGKMGYNRDFETATDKVRAERYKDEQKQMVEERRKLEQLKKEKEQLMKQKKQKGKK